MTSNGTARGFWRKIAIVGVVTTLVGLLVHLGRADIPFDPSIPEQQARALRAAAFYTEGSHSTTDLLLRGGVGFEHDTFAGIDRDRWRSLPSVYMLETMYLSAEAAKPGGGERALALMSRALAQRFKAAEDDPALKPYVEAARASPDQPADFRRIVRRAGVYPELTAPQTAAIDALAHYCEGGAGAFGQRSVLVERMGLEPTVAYEILRQPLSPVEVLTEGLKRVRVEDREAVLTVVVRGAEANFLNARAERDFEPYRKRSGTLDLPTWTGGPDSPRPWRPGDGPSPGAGGGGGGRGVGGGPTPTGRRPGGPPEGPIPPERLRDNWQTDRAADHRRFQEQAFAPRPGGLKPPAVRPRFGPAIRGGRGFGGVVLGNDVTGAGLPRVRSVAWEADATATDRGSLVVTFANGERASLGDVSGADASAAHAIYFRRLGVGDEAVGPADPPDAVGLVGIRRAGPYFDCGPERIVNRGEYWTVVMHPAIADSELGLSVLRCDVLPFPRVRTPVLDAVRSQAGEAVARALLGNWDNPKVYTWKFTDVPIAVAVRAGRLIVTREANGGGREFDEELRNSALITMNAYQLNEADPLHENDLIEDFADGFYPLVPALCRASPDYRRLNEFARVCAVIRWAKKSGASFESAPAPPAPRPRAAGLVVTETGDLIPGPAVNPKELVAGLRQKVLLRIALLELRRPVLEAVGRRLAEGPLPPMGSLLDLLADAVVTTRETQPDLVEAAAKLKGQIGRDKPSAVLERLNTLRRQYAVRFWRGASMQAGFDKVYLPQIQKAEEDWALYVVPIRRAAGPEFEYWLELRQVLQSLPRPSDR